jgi:hypothetical protein
MTKHGEAFDSLAKSLEYVFTSSSQRDQNGEEANVVDGLFAIARALDRIGNAIERLAPVEEPENHH